MTPRNITCSITSSPVWCFLTMEASVGYPQPIYLPRREDHRRPQTQSIYASSLSSQLFGPARLFGNRKYASRTGRLLLRHREQILMLDVLQMPKLHPARSRAQRHVRSLGIALSQLSLEFGKFGLTVTTGQLLVFIFLLHDFKLLTPLGLE